MGSTDPTTCGCRQRIDRLIVRNVKATRNRSQIIRQAVAEFVAQHERQAEEEREREIFQKHRQRLARQASALVKEQAKAQSVVTS